MPTEEHLERPAGAIDGSNRDFATSLPFEPGSLRLWRDGVLVRADDDDGFEETGPTTFRTREAPRPSDTLLVRYVDE